MTEAVETEAIVFVVDDDPSMRKALSNLFRSVGLRAEVFGSARELLESSIALEAARAGARRAREALTWDAAATAHLELYRELT